MDIMATVGRVHNYEEWSKWFRLLREQDSHKWIIAMETGTAGHAHWQVAIRGRWEDGKQLVFEDGQIKEKKVPAIEYARRQLLELFGNDGRQVHVEEMKSEAGWKYETKDGRYLASWDTLEVRKQRWGQTRFDQNWVLQRLRDTNDREVMVWYDPQGNAGKSWLVGHLYETGQAYYCPPYLDSVKQIIQTVASLALEDRKAGNPPRPYVVIDIPRSWKWSEQLYTAIEAIKDGLIMEPRYSAQPINIRGVKVLVLTNTEPKLDKLSKDRWVIHTQGQLL